MAKMKMSIHNPNNYDLSLFLTTQIIPIFKNLFREDLSTAICDGIDKKLNLPKKTKQILLESLKYLIIKKQNNDVYDIEIDPNIKIPELDITYEKFVAMITYGSLSIKPYPIYQETFNKIKKYFDSILLSYSKGARVCR